MPAPLMNLLNKAQLAELRAASLKILAEYGMKIEDEAVRKQFVAHGCIEKDDRVLIPAELIDQVCASAHSKIHFKRGSWDFNLEHGFPRTHSTGGAPWIMDADGTCRNATTQDMVDSLKLMNHLDQLDLPCCLLYPSDVPASISQYTQTEAMFRNCKKPIYAPGISMAGNAEYIAELFKLMNTEEGSYVAMTGVSPETPLHLPKEITDILRTVIGAGMPVSILAAPMAGLTGPITVTGCVAQCYAEMLATATYCWMVNPNTPVIMAARTFFTNMKYAQAILGLPENGISTAMCAALAAEDGFLSDVYGMACTALAPDQQSGYEKMFNAIVPALNGAALITGLGSLASVMYGSLGQLVLDNEMFAMIRRCFYPFGTDEESVGLEAIESVVLDDSTFLIEPHTIENLRSDEVFHSTIGFDRMPEEGDSVNANDLIQEAHKKARALIEADETTPLSEEVEREMASITAAARKNLLK